MALGSYLKAVFPMIDQTFVASIVILFFHAIHMKSIDGALFPDWFHSDKVG
ncbi:hypothetical protein Ct9H90mP29_17330 [bacterium]|nr:MAG: hypothetical protein Ct9H90mP29_17330 [bacterium]